MRILLRYRILQVNWDQSIAENLLKKSNWKGQKLNRKRTGQFLAKPFFSLRLIWNWTSTRLYNGEKRKKNIKKGKHRFRFHKIYPFLQFSISFSCLSVKSTFPFPFYIHFNLFFFFLCINFSDALYFQLKSNLVLWFLRSQNIHKIIAQSIELI